MKQYDNNLDASEHYHEIEYGEGGVAKAKEIIMKKIGLNEESTDYLVSQSEKFAIWLADSIVKKEMLRLDFNKKDTIEFINKRNNHIQYNYSTPIREILDWLQHPVTPKQELKTLSFDEALEKSKQWHDELQVLGGDIDFVEPERNEILKEYPIDSDGVKYYWAYIPSNYCDLESSRMGHCGRTGYGNTLISLRSIKPYGKGHTLSDSHVTIAYGEDGIFYQVKGKKNQKPAQKYQPYIFDLIKLLLNNDVEEINKNKKIKKLNSEIESIDEELNNIKNELSNNDNESSSEYKEKTTDNIVRLIDKRNVLKKQLENQIKFNFTGFGSEYGNEEDYGFEDMTKEQLRELYEINPIVFNDVESVLAIYDADVITKLELQTKYDVNAKNSMFSSFGGQMKLYDRGIVENKPSTIITISKDCDDVSDLLDISRDTRDDIVEMVLCGDIQDLTNSWDYWFDNASDLVDNLNKENEELVINEIVSITGLEKSIVKENGIKYYLDGEDEDFDKDDFDDIVRALVNAQSSAEESDYYKFLYDSIKNSLEEYGKVIELNDTGVEIEFDLTDKVDISEIIEKMDYMETDDVEDVFNEFLSDGTIDRPALNIDSRYSPYGSDDDFNDAFDINNYKKGGRIVMNKYGNSTDASEHYHEIEYGEGGVAKAKEIIMKKIGLNEENADYLVSQSEKFAIWLADSIVKMQINITEGLTKEQGLKFLNDNPSIIKNTLRTRIRGVLDWLQHPVTPKQNLRELSFSEAEAKAKQWHDELQVLGGDIDFVEPEKNQILKEYPKDSDGVQYYWVFIPSNYCDLESSRMGHCGRTGYGNTLISLRSIKPYGKGHTLSDSHVTIAYGSNGSFYQIKGKKNQKPAEKYQSYIFDLIKEMLTNEELKHQFNEDETFTGFGSEYASSEDYGWEDMTKEQLIELYEINPNLFNDFAGQYMLYKAGISNEKPNTTIIIEKPVKYVSDLLSLDRDLSDDVVEKVLTGDTFEWFDGSSSWSYYYDNASDYVDDLNEKNYRDVIDKIISITGLDKSIVEENGAKYYLAGNDDDFESDDFDDINRAIASALRDGEESAYVNYYFEQIEDALSELGTVKKINDEGVEIEIDLTNSLTISQISDYLKELETDSLEDVFFEAERNGDVELPNLSINDSYSPSVEDINEYFDINNYKKGGKVDMKETKINELYKKSKFISDDFSWENKLLEMLQDNSYEAYQIYQSLSEKEKEDVLQELYSMDNDMGSYGDGEIETSIENLSILLDGAKNGKKYAKGGEIVDSLYNNLVNYVKEQKYKKHEKYFLETIKMYFKQDRDFKSFPMENENLELNDFMDYVVEMENDEHLKYIIITIEKFKKKYGYTEEDLYAKGGDVLTRGVFFIVDKDGVPSGYEKGYMEAFSTDNLLRHQEDWEGKVSDYDIVSESLLLKNNYNIEDVYAVVYYDKSKKENIVFGDELKEPYSSFYLNQLNKENQFAKGGGVKGIEKKAEKLLKKSITYEWVSNNMGNGWEFQLNAPFSKNGVSLDVLDRQMYLDDFVGDDLGLEEDWDDLSEEDKKYYFEDWKQELFDSALDVFVKKQIENNLDYYIEYLQRDKDEDFANGGGVDDEDWIEESLIDLQNTVKNDNLIVDNSDSSSYTATNGSDEYLVFKTEDNAREVAIERVKEDLTENPQYFSKSWLSEYVDGESFFTDMYNEWNEGYVNDIESEDSDEYANRLIEEMVDNGIISREEAKEDDFDAEYYKNDYTELLTSNQIDEGNGGLDYYISNFGEEEAFKVVLNNNLINVEDASENAIDTDGIAHFISSYDGKQINLSNGHVAYRIN
jgi:hypothetical protein